MTDTTGPRRASAPCEHDSSRVDGTLDAHCLRCGANGYWHRGHRHDESHPSGQALLRLECRGLSRRRDRPMPDSLRDAVAEALLEAGPLPQAWDESWQELTKAQRRSFRRAADAVLAVMEARLLSDEAMVAADDA